MRRRKPVDSLGDDDLLDAADDPELLALKARHLADFKQAFQAAVADLEPRDRAILRALIVDDRSIGEIAAVYGIHRVTASRWVSEIRHTLLQGTRKRLKATLQLDTPSLDSAIRMIDSNLELSLYRLLARRNVKKARYTRTSPHIPEANSVPDCPDETELVRFLARSLPAPRARALEAHFDRCRDCRGSCSRSHVRPTQLRAGRVALKTTTPDRRVPTGA